MIYFFKTLLQNCKASLTYDGLNIPCVVLQSICNSKMIVVVQFIPICQGFKTRKHNLP